MSIPLQINDMLFWWYKSAVKGAWGLGCGDGYTDDMVMDYVQFGKDRGVDGVMLLLNNEGYISLFSDGYMNTVNMGKYNKLIQRCDYFRANGIKIVFAFYDGPEDKAGPYYPILSQMNKHPEFIRAACQALNPYAAAYVIGCETSRYWSSGIVSEAIYLTKQHAGLIPVGTHMVWNPATYPFPGGDFLALETRNHPKDGDAVSVRDMVAEVQSIQSHLPAGFSLWVSEFNWNDSQRCRDQANALAQLPGVVGVGQPLR